jgi:hypothetical protein
LLLIYLKFKILFLLCKIRFLNYDYVDATDNPDRNSNYDYIVTNGNKQEVRFRVFFGWKMGVRF